MTILLHLILLSADLKPNWGHHHEFQHRNVPFDPIEWGRQFTGEPSSISFTGSLPIPSFMDVVSMPSFVRTFTAGHMNMLFWHSPHKVFRWPSGKHFDFFPRSFFQRRSRTPPPPSPPTSGRGSQRCRHRTGRPCCAGPTECWGPCCAGPSCPCCASPTECSGCSWVGRYLLDMFNVYPCCAGLGECSGYQPGCSWVGRYLFRNGWLDLTALLSQHL